MSYAYYYLYYEKSPNDKPKGAHHTPGRGVVGTLRLVYSFIPYAPDSVGWMDASCRRECIYRTKGSGSKFGMPKVLTTETIKFNGKQI